MPAGMERVVDGVIEAFNRHDAAGTAAFYAVDGELTSLMNGAPTVTGRDNIEAYFEQMFVTIPTLRATVKSRQRIGPVVLDHEHIDGLEADALAVYEVQGGHIARAWVFAPLPG